MSLADVYKNPNISKMEEKFSVTRKSDTEFIGNYPLEAFSDEARGTYGGEFVAQALSAAIDSIQDKDFQLHSLHSYFLKAGSNDSVMRYEVEATSSGRNYCSRLVKCYQVHNDQLCFIFMASFTRNNSIRSRQEAFSALPREKQRDPRTRVPFEFSRSPHWTFDKYASKVDDMSALEHTNGNLSHILVPETWRRPKKSNNKEPGLREFSLFVRVNDDLTLAKDQLKARLVAFAFASDSFYLGTVMRAVYPVLDLWKGRFFRVSLDHSIYIHDVDFDPSQWMFLQYRFLRQSNDRVLVVAQFYTMDKRLVATVQQEALCLFPLKLVEGTPHGTHKL